MVVVVKHWWGVGRVVGGWGCWCWCLVLRLRLLLLLLLLLLFDCVFWKDDCRWWSVEGVVRVLLPCN